MRSQKYFHMLNHRACSPPNSLKYPFFDKLFCQTRRLQFANIHKDSIILKFYFLTFQVNPLGPCFTNQTCYFIDTTDWLGPLYLALIIYGYIVPVNFIVTTICNSLVIIVLSQKNMRTPTNLVLLAMAIMDLLTIACPCPW